MDKWIDFLKYLFMSTIFETSFMVIVAYFIMGRSDLIDIHRIKYTLKNILIPVIPISIIMDLLRWIINIPQSFVKIICFILLYFVTVIWIKHVSIQNMPHMYFKTAYSLLLAYATMGIIEAVYIPITILLTKVDVKQFVKDINMLLIISIPARIFEITIILILLIKDNMLKKIKILHIILKNKAIMKINIISLFINMIWISIFVKSILFNGILANINYIDQLIVIALTIFSVPCITLLWNYYYIGYFIEQERRLQQLYEKS